MATRSTLKLIVFDCDGVMFDSRETNRIYYNDLLRAFGCPPMTEPELNFVHMHNVTESIRHLFGRHPGIDPADVDRYRLGLDYTPYLRHMVMEQDLPAFLDYARPRYHLAISTNRTNTMQPLLKEFKLEHYFDKVVTAADVARPKPAPDALVEILSWFGCEPEETIYIGDSVIDREHTRPLGIPLVAFKNPDLEAEFRVDSFTELKELEPFRHHPDRPRGDA